MCNVYLKSLVCQFKPVQFALFNKSATKVRSIYNLFRPKIARPHKYTPLYRLPALTPWSCTRTIHTTNPSYSISVGVNPQDKAEATSTQKTTGMVHPAGVVYNWDLRTYKPEQIASLSHEIINKVKERYDSVGKLGESDALTFETVLKPILQAHRLIYGSWNGVSAIVTFPLMVAESTELRDASTEAKKLFDLTSVEQSMRKDVFAKLVAYKERSLSESLHPEYARCLDNLIRKGRKNGLHLSDDVNDDVSKTKSKIMELELQFGRNLIENKTKLLFSADELAGMPSDFIEELKKDGETGKYIVTLDYPHLYPILKKCQVPSTRQQMQTANYSKCHPENTKLLEEILQLRHKEATMLGYKNHASFVLDGDTVANDPATVNAFLDDLTKKLQPLWEKERAIMLNLKAEECEKYGYQNSGKLEPWDTSYYANLVEEKFYNLDQEQLRPYFTFEAVTKGLLEIYQQLLGLSFTHLPDAEKWHDDVQVYQVDDSASGQLMGYFYLDLFPREGKYGHACCCSLQPNIPDENGVQLPAVATLLCNFTKPTKEKPALLTHDEVETYFHEFGHLMHCICAKTKTQRFSGYHVETDFLEAPSQMLENWVWEKEPLRRMSSHYETKEPLPNELIENLVKTRKVNAGGFNLRQISLGKFDQVIHIDGNVNTAELFAKTVKSIQGLDVPEGTNFAAGFGHIGKSYSARYYSYLWSEVFSIDMYESKFSKNPLSPEAGQLYRQKILEPGGSIDAKDMLLNFLGREPKSDAFLKSKGVSIA